MRVGPLLLLLAAPGTLAAQERPRRDTTRADSLRPVLLAPVIVSVTRSPTDPSHVPFAVTVVSRDEITRGRATQGLGEALVTVPGVFVADRHNPSQDDNLSIRGFGARSAFGVRGVKVLLDGIPQTLPDGQGQLSNVELARVTRIEVLRGPSSSLYGNASGGVISLRTDTDRPPAFEPLARANWGAFGTWKAYLAGAAPLGPGALSADASSWATNGFRAHSAGETRRASLRYAGDLSPGTHLVAQVLGAYSPRLQDPGALTAAEADTAPTAANPRNVAADVGKRVSQEQAGLSLEHRGASGLRSSLVLFGLRRDLKNPIATTYIELNRWAYGARLGSAVPLAPLGHAAVLTAGVDAQWQWDDRLNQSPDRTLTTRDQLERVSEIGPFLEVRADLTRRITLTLGGRYDRGAFRVDDRLLSDGDDSGARVMASPSGSAGLTLDLGAGLQPYADVSSSFETPTTTELGNRPTGPGGFNPDLQPQKAVNYEMGVRGAGSGEGGEGPPPRSPLPHWSYSLAAFQADIRDELIPFEVPGDPGRRYYRNAGSARHRGLEAGMALEALPGVTLVAAYTRSVFRFDEFRTATDTLDGNQIPGVPADFLHASLRVRGPQGAWVAADVSAASGCYADDRNSVRTAPWQTLGVRVGWEGRWGPYRMAPFAAVQNLLNERYIGSVSVNAQFGRYFEPAPGRNAYLGLEIRPY